MRKPLTWLAPETEVRESPIAGRGLFARAPIGAGSIVAVKGGAVMRTEEWLALEPSLGSAEIQVSEDLFIAPRNQDEREGSMVFTNHSCDPNIAVQGQIVFVAMRDIAAGEELTHDWATTDDLDYEMICNCGTAACRGVITGRDLDEARDTGEVSRVVLLVPTAQDRRGRLADPILGDRLFVELDAEARLLRDV